MSGISRDPSTGYKTADLLTYLLTCLCFTCTGIIGEKSRKVRRTRRHSAKQYLCTPSVVFTAEETLTVDRNRNTGEQHHSCVECGRHFLSQSGLYAHMNIHTSKYKCAECGKCCQDRSALAVHGRSHSGEKPFECPVCNRGFATSSQMLVHSRIHSGDKPYRCYICDKTFTVSASLNNHIRVHIGDKPYACSLCDKSFSDSGTLRKHTLLVHP